MYSNRNLLGFPEGKKALGFALGLLATALLEIRNGQLLSEPFWNYPLYPTYKNCILLGVISIEGRGAPTVTDSFTHISKRPRGTSTMDELWRG